MKTKISDERIKLINETILGIRLIKMYNWGKAFYKMITEKRATEMGYLLNFIYFSKMDRAFSKGMGMFCSIITFIIVYFND